MLVMLVQQASPPFKEYNPKQKFETKINLKSLLLVYIYNREIVSKKIQLLQFLR